MIETISLAGAGFCAFSGALQVWSAIAEKNADRFHLGVLWLVVASLMTRLA